MASIIPFLPDGMHLRDSVFEAHEIKAMSAAFDKVCEAMNLQDDSSAKQIMAARIQTPLLVALFPQRAVAECLIGRALEKPAVIV